MFLGTFRRIKLHQNMADSSMHFGYQMLNYLLSIWHSYSLDPKEAVVYVIWPRCYEAKPSNHILFAANTFSCAGPLFLELRIILSAAKTFGWTVENYYFNSKAQTYLCKFRDYNR